MRKYYEEVVLPLQHCVMDMQCAGALIDRDLMLKYRQQADNAMAEKRREWQELLGYEFNPNSSQQCVKLIENDLQCKMFCKRGSVKPSADKISMLKTVMKEPRLEPIVKSIIEYREFNKLSGTYLSLELDRNDRVHSTIRTYGTLTMRLSSQDPDLQNLPREPKYDINVKDIYIAKPGHVLLSRDYSQLEYRIPVWASGEQSLIDIFCSGHNVHEHNATLVFKRPITKKANKKEYTLAKTVKYAEGYGGGPHIISDTILKETYEYIDPTLIKQILDVWRGEYVRMYAWHEAGHKQAMEGVLYDGFGMPRVLFGDPNDRRNLGYSWPTATTASGIMNRAMVRYWKGQYRHDLGMQLILQVHDELTFEVPEQHANEANKLIKADMEHPVVTFGNEVVYPTEGAKGTRYGSMTPTGD